MTRDLTKLQQQQLNAIQAIQDAYERELFINYKTALDDIRVQLGKIYEQYSKAGALTYAEMSKFNRLEKLQRDLSDILGPTLSANGRLVEDLRKVQYQESFYRHAWAIDQSAGVSLRWGLLNPKTIEAAVNQPEWRKILDISIKDFKRTHYVRMDRIVTQGLIQGQGYDKMAREIKKGMDGLAGRAMTIARTEGGRSQTIGQVALYDEAEDLGVKIKRIWDATLDMATRPEHGELDGTAADEDGIFHTVAGPIIGPRTSGDPSFDINFRCSVRPEVEGYPPKVRRLRDEGVQEYKTYKQWAAEKGIRVNKYGQKL